MPAGSRPLLALFWGVMLMYNYASGQTPILARNVSVHVKNQPLGTILKGMETKGNFRFSYNSNLLRTDSLVTLNINNLTVRDALNDLLKNRFEYRETGSFLILRYAPMQLRLTDEKSTSTDDHYTITGYIVDDRTGAKLSKASVYTRRSLQSTLSDENGYFELNVKADGRPIVLTVSKEMYRDTSITFLNEVMVKDNNGDAENTVFGYAIDNSDELENTTFGRWFISTGQKIQSLNLGGLITQSPFQASLVPGLSTHGSFSGQVVNQVSLNAVAGYNAGVNGVEVGIAFNINKGDVKSFQLAGGFNLNGGNVNGVQIAGLYNNNLGNLDGFQLSLLLNNTGGNARGLELAIGGNITGKSFNGLQIASFNIVNNKFEGVQTGVFNYSRRLRGLQLGLVNIADTSAGFSLGLINYVSHGYHTLGLSANETFNVNIALKTGNPQLYTALLGGMHTSPQKLFAFGYGLGSLLKLSNRLAFNPEISCRYVYQGDWDHTNLLSRIDACLTLKVSDFISITAGPSFNAYYSDQTVATNNYALVKDIHRTFPLNNHNFNGWIGWTIGINLF